MEELPLAVFVSDLDGTLTFFPGPPLFLGDLTPKEATSPLTRFTRRLTQVLLESEVPGMIVTKNTPENLQKFLEWSKAELDQDWADLTQSTQDKVETYRQILKAIPEEALLIFAEDSTKITPQLLLLDPKRMIAIPAKESNVPQQLVQFLGSDDPKRIKDELWVEFLAQKWREWNSEPWVILREVLDSIPGASITAGPKFLTVVLKERKLFRVSRAGLEICAPTGNKIRGNLLNEEQRKRLWGFKI